MSFPWGQSTLPVTFVCPHCGDTKTIIRETVPVCDCAGSESQAAADREQMVVHRRSQEEARKIRMKEIHAKRRKRLVK
jgi:hypothetical protein